MASEKMRRYKHCIEQVVTKNFTFDIDNRSNKVKSNKISGIALWKENSV